MTKFKYLINQAFKYNWINKIDSYIIRKGLNKSLFSDLLFYNNEISFISEYRKKAFMLLKIFKLPDWSFNEIPDINYDSLIYYSYPKNKLEVSKELKLLLKKLNISKEFSYISKFAIDIVFDSLSIISIIKPFLLKIGIIFIPLFEAYFKYSKLIKKYFGTVVSYTDNFFATLNSAVFSEGSFCYIPKNIKWEFDLSTYFRTSTENYAQFERTLIIIGNNSSVSYLEGCTAPLYKESQLHVAIVEIIVKKFGKINYFTVQNWYKGNFLGEGGIYNFTTKRGFLDEYAQLDWFQIELGSSFTWKYPSSYLIGNFSKSNFFSISFLSNYQYADTGGKMIHKGLFTTSRILSKSISLNSSQNIYRGLVEIDSQAFFCTNKTECDSLIIGNNSLTATIPYSKISNYCSNIQQEAYISNVDFNYLFFLMQRGISVSAAINLIINGFCFDISSKLPLEFASELPLLFSLKMKENLNL